jgi:hypothetical protein
MSDMPQETKAAASGPITLPPLEDRRLVSRVLRHMAEYVRDQRLPRLNDVDPWLVGDDWSNCALARIREPLDHSVFLAVGDNLLPERGTLLDREPISRCPASTLLGVGLSFLAQAVTTRTLLMVEGGAIHLGAQILYRGLLVPLSDDGEKIDAVLIAANFREVRDQQTGTVTRLVWSHSFTPSVR